MVVYSIYTNSDVITAILILHVYCVVHCTALICISYSEALVVVMQYSITCVVVARRTHELTNAYIHAHFDHIKQL
jgi:hypothetical protein